MADVQSDELEAISIQSLNDMWLPTFVRNHPFLDDLDRKKDGGRSWLIPIQTGPGGGASSQFGASLTNSAANGFTGTGFTVPPAIVYGTTRIQWQDQVYSAQKQSPVDIAMNATKNALELGVENLANMILGNSSGAAGSYATIAVAANTSGNIWLLTLTAPTDASKFAIGQVVKSKDSPSAAINTGSGTVTGVNAVGGQIQIDVASSGMTPTATEIIGLEGQLPETTDTSGLFPDVLRWIPPAALRTDGVPTVSPFLGVTRTAASNVAAVSGWAFDGSSTPIFQAVYATAAYMQNNSALAKPNKLYCNPLVLPKMAQACDQKIRYDMKSTSGVDVEFAGFTVVLPTGKCDVVAEPSMPPTQMLLSKAGSWEFVAPGSGDRYFFPATNGKMIVDDYGAGTGLNQSRCSVMATGFFGCNNPSANAIITVGLGTGLNL